LARFSFSAVAVTSLSWPPACFVLVATENSRISFVFDTPSKRLRSSSLLSSPESSTPTILSTSLSLPPNSSFTRASGLCFNASAAAAMGPRISFVA